MDVVLVFPSASANMQALVRAIKKSVKMQIILEGAYIICKTDNPSRAASVLSGLSGVGGTVVAEKVSSRFSEVTSAIVLAGGKAILPGQKFYVKVIQTAKTDYVGRDVEFASSGALVDMLAEINALPAKSEQEADCMVLAVVGKRSAYVCVKGKT